MNWTKRPPWNFLMPILCALMLCAGTLFALPGCDGSTTMKNAEPALRAIIDRHDAYVNADTKIDPTEKRIALRSTELIRTVLDTANKKTPKVGMAAKTSEKIEASVSTKVDPGWHCDMSTGRCKIVFHDLTPQTKAEPRAEVIPVTMVSTDRLAAQGLYFESEALLLNWLKENPDEWKAQIINGVGADINTYLYKPLPVDPSTDKRFNAAPTSDAEKTAYALVREVQRKNERKDLTWTDFQRQMYAKPELVSRRRALPHVGTLETAMGAALRQ